MLEFEEYKVKLNNLKPELEELYTSLGLEQAKREVEELEIKSSQPGFWDNPEESQKIVSRMGSLKGKVEAYNKMTELCDDLLTICEMAIEENDESMLEELENGYKELEDGIAEQKLRTLLTGEYDSHNALVSFHAGAGGTEAQDWCAMLYRMYTRWAERHGFTYKIMDYQDGDTAGIKSADILIEGENAYGFLKGENGVHRLVRISPFDASGRRQTSFSAVEVVPDIPDTSTDFEIKPDDYEMQVYRSSGAGGFTMPLPEEDQAYRTKKYMEEYIIVCLGGRVAEQLTMEDISTGAYGDIKQATQMARAMVTSYGMSERIGPIDYGSDNGEVFLGRDLAAGKGYSEVKAAEIDDEIHRIIEHAYHACEKLLSEHMDEMKRVAEYLIRNETMDGETFVKVYNGEIVPDKIVGEDLMTELQQELHAKVSKPAESAEELAKVEEAEKDLDPDKQDQ